MRRLLLPGFFPLKSAGLLLLAGLVLAGGGALLVRPVVPTTPASPSTGPVVVRKAVAPGPATGRKRVRLLPLRAPSPESISTEEFEPC